MEVEKSRAGAAVLHAEQRWSKSDSVEPTLWAVSLAFSGKLVFYGCSQRLGWCLAASCCAFL